MLFPDAVEALRKCYENAMRMVMLTVALWEVSFAIASLMLIFGETVMVSNDPNSSAKQRFWIKIVVSFAVAVAALWFANQFDLLDTVQLFLQHSLDWIQDAGALGSLVFMAVYVLATVLFLPASVLTLGAGAAFGVFAGAVYVIIAATIGANLAFLIGRYLARERVAKLIDGNPKFKAIDQAVAQEGWKIIGLIRLSPAFPFNVLNYALGLTQVSFRDNLIGTMGIVPGTFMYVYIGSLAGNLATLGSETDMTPEGQLAQWMIRIVGLIATIAVTVYVTRIARKALQSQHLAQDAPEPISDPG